MRCVQMFGHRSVDVRLQQDIKEFLGDQYLIMWHGKINRYVLYYHHSGGMILQKILVIDSPDGTFAELGPWVLDLIKRVMLGAGTSDTPEVAADKRITAQDEHNDKLTHDRYEKPVEDMQKSWAKDLSDFKTHKIWTCGVKSRKVTA